MNDIILGSFYLRLTDNGNLIGEYTNNRLLGVTTETAVFIRPIPFHDDLYEGVYSSIWQEQDGPEIAQLEIIFNQDRRKYLLTWTIRTRSTFIGEGFLVDGILIGAYTDNLAIFQITTLP